MQPLKFNLNVEIARSFSLNLVKSIFDPSNPALASAIGDARRLVVVTDNSAGHRRSAIYACMRRWQDAGQIDNYFNLHLELTGDIEELQACGTILDAGICADLGRNDAFISIGNQRLKRLVSLAAMSFRRYTNTIHVLCDLPSVVETLRSGNRVTLDEEPVAATQRTTQIVIDEDGVCCDKTLEDRERISLLRLSLLDATTLHRLSSLSDVDTHEQLTKVARREGLQSVLNLCQWLGPGHEAWRIGESAPPWIAELNPPIQPVASLIVTAEEATRRGLLPVQAFERVQEVARWLYPDLKNMMLRSTRKSGPPIDSSHGATMNPKGQETGSEAIDNDVLVLAFAHRKKAPTRIQFRSSASVSDDLAGRSASFNTQTGLLHSFKVEFKSGVLEPERDAIAHLLGRESRVLAVVDAYNLEIVRRVERCLSHYRAGHIAGSRVLPMHVTSKEKTFDKVLTVMHAADELGLDQADRIIVVGGGTIMDVVGYAAFMYSGDTPYIRIPTTLVGMIDAGIGLKVGVNLAGRKNLIGAYHPPIACVCDTGFPRTLPAPELRCGASEALKMGMISDAHLFELIEKNHSLVIKGTDCPDILEIINRAISSMLHELEANPFEFRLRRLPDFGHEFGHLLESLSQYRLRHGEAVALGMLISCKLAEYLGYLSSADFLRMATVLRALGLPIWDAVCDPDRLWTGLREDVLPHKGGQLHLVVPSSIGTGTFIDSLDEISPVMMKQACCDLRALVGQDDFANERESIDVRAC